MSDLTNGDSEHSRDRHQRSEYRAGRWPIDGGDADHRARSAHRRVGGSGQLQRRPRRVGGLLHPRLRRGSAVIADGYTLTITDQTNPSDPSNGLTVDGSDSPITVSGLTSGDTYSFTVTATNGIGTGASSLPSTGVPSP